jgi:hypothetical protein
MNCELMLTYDTPALQQTGSRNLTGQKTLPINSYWEKCDEKYLGLTEGRTDRQTDRGKTVYPPPPSGIKYLSMIERIFIQQQVRDFQPHYDKNQFLFDKMVTMYFLYNHIMTRTSFSLIRWWQSFFCTRAIYRDGISLC